MATDKPIEVTFKPSPDAPMDTLETVTVNLTYQDLSRAEQVAHRMKLPPPHEAPVTAMGVYAWAALWRLRRLPTSATGQQVTTAAFLNDHLVSAESPDTDDTDSAPEPWAEGRPTQQGHA